MSSNSGSSPTAVPSGVKVFYNYYRVPYDYVKKNKVKGGKPPVLRPYVRRPKLTMGDKSFEPYSNGGEIMCYVVDSSGTILSMGKSVCSMSETFNYKKGRQIALGRALKTMDKSLMS